jgi:mRNA-decapping enzyme subunit 2
MPPPPPFPFHGPHGIPFGGPQYPPIPPPQHNGFPGPGPHQFAPPPLRHMSSNFPPHPPNMQHHFEQPPPRPMEQTGNPLFANSPQHHGPHGPPASELPRPKLTAHTLGLLNAFKLNEKPAISSPQGSSQPERSFQSTPNLQQQQQQPPLQRAFDSYASPVPRSAHPYAPSPPAFQSPPPQANFQPVQPKPRNPHQDSLLNLFRSPSMVAATPAQHKTPEQPAELSAAPSTPGYARTSVVPNPGPPVPNLHTKPNEFLDSFQAYTLQQNKNKPNLQPNRPGQTSATVRGPVNAPDFETVKKNSHHPLNGHSRGSSPALPKQEQKVFIPQQILKRETTPGMIQSPTVELSATANSSPLTVVPPTAAFKPQILKRPQQSGPAAPVTVSAAHSQGLLNLFKSPSPTPPQPSPPMHTLTQAPHSQDLLNLFTDQTSPGPLPVAASDVQPAASRPSAHSQGLLNLFKSPTPPQAAPAPPAPPANIPSPLSQLPSRPNDQKNALLSLFGKPSSHANSPTLPSKSPLPISPMPIARSPQPPTPKTQMSGIISPVSPLPEKGSQTGSPAHLTSRSRISSLGEGGLPNIVIPRSDPVPTLVPQKNGIGAGIGVEGGFARAGSPGMGELGAIDKGKARVIGGGEGSEGKSPVDKTFLLGFLNDVARKGR